MNNVANNDILNKKFLKSHSHLPENESPLKIIKKSFLFHFKTFLFLRYLNFCPGIFDHIGKQLDKKTKVNFKIYDLKNWETKN